MLKLLIVLLLGLAMSSCAYMNELAQRSCEGIDWNSQGSQEALAGKKRDAAAANDCEIRGVRVDRKAYEAGYAEGLKRFCTREYGEYFGREGGKYQQTCPGAFENNFLAGFSRGKLDYERLQLERTRTNAFQSMVSANTPTGRACTFNSDCETHISCLPSTSEPGVRRCAGNGVICTFNSDCTVKAQCVGGTCR